MVWSNQAVDKITVPASVPIGPGQDGVIISGADIPVELKAINITAAIIFQRGDYPSEGTLPEAKYFFVGLSKLGYNFTSLTIGTVVDPKGGGALVAVDNIDLPFRYKTIAIPGQGNVWTARLAQFAHMEFSLGWGNHSTASAIDALKAPPHAGQTFTTQNWYNVALNTGWTSVNGSAFLWGVEFKPTADGIIQLRGGVVCGVASSASSVICNIGTNDYFKTFPDRIHTFTGTWDTPGSNTCQLLLSPNGDLSIGTVLNPPPNGANLVFATSYYGQQ